MNVKKVIEDVENLMLGSIDDEVLYDADGRRVFIGDYVRDLCNNVKDIIRNS